MQKGLRRLRQKILNVQKKRKRPIRYYFLFVMPSLVLEVAVRLQLDLYSRDYPLLRRLAQEIVETADGFDGDMLGRTVQVIQVHDDFDNTGGDLDNEPAHGDSVTESRYTIDLTIWFQE